MRESIQAHLDETINENQQRISMASFFFGIKNDYSASGAVPQIQ